MALHVGCRFAQMTEHDDRFHMDFGYSQSLGRGPLLIEVSLHPPNAPGNVIRTHCHKLFPVTEIAKIRQKQLVLDVMPVPRKRPTANQVEAWQECKYTNLTPPYLSRLAWALGQFRQL